MAMRTVGCLQVLRMAFYSGAVPLLNFEDCSN